MTRETKVGLTVATTFLTLVSLVIASKLRGQDDANGDVAGARQVQPGPNDPAKNDFEASESHGDKPPGPAPVKPRQDVPPGLQFGARPSTPFALPMPQQPAGVQPASDSVATPVVVDVLPTVPGLPVEPESKGSGWWGRYAQNPEAPAITPVDAALPGVRSGPHAGMDTPNSPFATRVAQVEQPNRLPGSAPVVPTVPAGDPLPLPLPTPLGGTTKPEADPILPLPKPIEPQTPPTTKPDGPIPMPPPIALPEVRKERKDGDPIRLPPPPGSEPPNGKQPMSESPLPTPIPIAPLLTEKTGSNPNSPTPIQEPSQTPMPDQPRPGRPDPATAPRPVSIGAIGTSGSDIPVTPALSPPMAPASAPSAVPSLGAASGELPKVISHSDDVHRTAPGETTFAQLSQRYYGTDKYAQALWEYNRRHLLGRTNPDLQRNPPVLQPNQPLYYPHPNVLESQLAAFIPKTSPTVAALPAIGNPPVQISPPMPLTATAAGIAATTDATVNYTVPQTDHILRIAQQTLGSMDAWTEIVHLNPSLRTDAPIPAGTVLRLPAKARVN
jgi:hypothetical protein